ncbi:MAG: type II toxin-antitoxin system prevent-host-death family antitoxin [Phycisphaerae bacterium]|nr:type II toxin-antitoxin system prevent-host-death family antitoxin [Phycisphaerae bacterium]
MITVTIEDAGGKFTELLRRAAGGEEIIITEQGKPIARLSPMSQEPDQRKFPMSLEELREWRKGITLGPDLTIKQLIEEGRRH